MSKKTLDNILDLLNNYTTETDTSALVISTNGIKFSAFINGKNENLVRAGISYALKNADFFEIIEHIYLNSKKLKP